MTYRPNDPGIFFADFLDTAPLTVEFRTGIEYVTLPVDQIVGVSSIPCVYTKDHKFEVEHDYTHLRDGLCADSEFSYATKWRAWGLRREDVRLACLAHRLADALAKPAASESVYAANASEALEDFFSDLPDVPYFWTLAGLKLVAVRDRYAAGHRVEAGEFEDLQQALLQMSRDYERLLLHRPALEHPDVQLTLDELTRALDDDAEPDSGDGEGDPDEG